MAGQINRRKLSAAKDCRGTIPVGSTPDRARPSASESAPIASKRWRRSASPPALGRCRVSSTASASV
jgi:hypothetical protein